MLAHERRMAGHLVGVAFLACSVVAQAVPALGQSATDPKKCMLIGAAPGEENEQWNAFIEPRLEAWGYAVDRIHTRIELLEYTRRTSPPTTSSFSPRPWTRGSREWTG